MLCPLDNYEMIFSYTINTSLLKHSKPYNVPFEQLQQVLEFDLQILSLR